MTWDAKTMEVEKGKPRAIPEGWLVEDGWRLKNGNLYLILVKKREQ